MQLAVHSFQFPLLPFEKVCEVISALEIPAVDIGALKGYAHLEPDEIESNPDAVVEKVRRAVGEQELRVSDFFPSFGTGFGERPVNDPDSSTHRANLKRFQVYVDVAQKIGSPGITLLPGIVFPEMGVERSLDLAAGSFQEFLPIAEEAGLRLSFEAHIGGLLETPEDVLTFLDEVPGLTVTLDYSHFVAKDIPVERVHPLLARAGHFHFRQTKPGQVQVGAREGVLDPVDIALRLQASGYDGYFTIEYTWQDWENCKNVDTISETILVRDQIRPLTS